MKIINHFILLRIFIVQVVIFISIPALMTSQNKNELILPHMFNNKKYRSFNNKNFKERLFQSFKKGTRTNTEDSITYYGGKSDFDNKKANSSELNIEKDINAEWVRQYASNLFPSDDYANALSISRKGDIIVTGTSFTTYTDADMFTVKYNTHGDTIWTKRYNGNNNGYDEAVAVGTDIEENVYVAGYSNVNQKVECVLIKYDGQGNSLWEKRIPDPYDSIVVPTTLFVDQTDGIFICGYAFRGEHSYDIFVARYSFSGELLWLEYYDGVTGDIDVATSISVSERNLFVVGGFSRKNDTGYDALILWFSKDGSLLWMDRYSGSGVGNDYYSTVSINKNGEAIGAGVTFASNYDMLIVKYTVNGDREWVVIQDGSYNLDDQIATGMVDDSGNVFVAGSITTVSEYENLITLRYNSNGLLNWKAIYNGIGNYNDGAIALILDKKYKKVYVTGYSYNYPRGDQDLITIKYDYNGKILWIAKYANPNGGDDIPVAIAIDANGDLVVSGKTNDAGLTSDFLTIRYLNFEADQWPVWFNNSNGPNSLKKIHNDNLGYVYIAGTDTAKFILCKYDSLGSKIWMQSFESSQSKVGSMVIDKERNIYLAGSMRREESGVDGVLIKLNTNGEILWQKIYNYMQQGNDYFSDIAMDSTGFIYVTGTSYAAATSADFITIKYDKDGNQLWSMRFSGPYNYRDSAVAIAVSNSGDVYVTGTGIRINSSYDYLTLKYSNEGNLVWANYYNGTGNGGDFASGIAVDDQGNVYVTGRSYGFFTLSDYATIKYSPGGDLLWVSRFDAFNNSYDDAYGLVVDKEKNVYVTGIGTSSSTGYDIFTIKYNSNGSQMWRSRFNGPANSDDYPASIILDKEGFLYLVGTSVGRGTGKDIITIKLNPVTGSDIWNFRSNYLANNDDIGTSITTDNINSIYVGGNSQDMMGKQGILLVKYTTAGTTDQLWSARIGGPGISFDRPNQILTDENGNLIIGGASIDPATGEDFTVLEYSSDGIMLKQTRYNSLYNYDDDLVSMVKDKSGNLYLAGTIYSRIYTCDYGIVKYSSDGIKEWDKYFNGDAKSYDFLSGMVLDDSDNVIITGYSAGTFSYDLATIKYSPSGEEMWISIYDADGGGDDLAYAITKDKQNNILIAGFSYYGSSNSDYNIVKYSSAGNLIWSRRYTGMGGYDDRIVDMVVDVNNNIYVTGWSGGLDTTYDIVTIKYNSYGDSLWMRRYSGISGSNQFAVSMVYNNFDKIFVTGRQTNQNSPYGDIITIAYDTDGNQLWSHLYDGSFSGDDAPASMAINSESEIFIVGKTMGQDKNYDFIIIKYDSTGNIKWQTDFSTLPGCNDEAVDIAIDNNNNVIVTGISKGNNWSIISTIKYSKLETNVIENLNNVPDFIKLEQNYPNPFNSETTIHFHLPNSNQKKWVSLSLYNITGQRIKTILDSPLTHGDYYISINADELASGTYIYHLKTADGYSLSKKMVILK